MLNIIKDVENKYKDKPHRLLHIKGVVKTAVLLARHYHVNEIDALIAAWFHDYTKYDSLDEQKKHLTHEEIDKYKDFEIMYHAISASKILKEKYGIHHKDILNAIYYHVWGRPNMTILEKIILVADKTEPTRSYESVDLLRKLSYESLDLTIIQLLEDNKIYLKNQGYEYPSDVDKIIQELKGV